VVRCSNSVIIYPLEVGRCPAKHQLSKFTRSSWICQHMLNLGSRFCERVSRAWISEIGSVAAP
jgi:hypothetical protein